MTNPFSLPISCGSVAGTLSAVAGGEHRVTYKKISPDVYEFTSNWTEYPEELMERFVLPTYHHVEGDFELQKCQSCGGPRALEGYRWDVEKGLIVNRDTGQRMAVLIPGFLDSLFDELADELGPTIPDTVVEAQRLFTRTGFYSIEQIAVSGDFRTQLALRGLGNLHEIEMGDDGLLMKVDNASAYLMVAGMVQGLFEMAFNMDSKVDWEMSPEKRLRVEVTPL